MRAVVARAISGRTASSLAQTRRNLFTTMDAPAIVSSEAHAAPLDFSSFVLDPACRTFLDRLGPRPDPASVPLAARRTGLHTLIAANTGSGPRVRRVEDIDAGGVPVRVYRSEVAPGALSPCLVYLHGGGWNAGSVSDYDVQMRALAVASRVVIVSVEYRLAPETTAPAQADDALTALEWVHTHAADIGVDAARVGLGGDSAGGCITAAASQELAARRAGPLPPPPPLALQLLVYPSLDLSCSSGASYAQCARGYMIETGAVAFLGRGYAGDLAVTDPRVSPLLAPPSAAAGGDFALLPQALIYSAGFDPLRR